MHTRPTVDVGRPEISGYRVIWAHGWPRAELFAPLEQTLAEAGIGRAVERSAVTDLIGGLVLSAAQREERLGTDPTVSAFVGAAINGLLPRPAKR